MKKQILLLVLVAITFNCSGSKPLTANKQSKKVYTKYSLESRVKNLEVNYKELKNNTNKNSEYIKRSLEIDEKLFGLFKEIENKQQQILVEIEKIKNVETVEEGNSTIKYPPSVDIDNFDFDNWNPSTLNPITEGFTTTDDIGGQSTLTLLAPDNQDRFKGYYSKHTVFNADDTMMKFRADSGTALVPVADAGNPNAITYLGVENRGYWSNVDPELLYVIFNYTGSDVAVKAQTTSTSYGNETLLHDFTSTHDEISFGFNEGNISLGDLYVAVTAEKKAGYSGLKNEVIILDLQDCLANPNQASNIHSRMDIIDDGSNEIDWVSMSQTGDYVVIAYSDNTTINPINGNAIEVYDNTPTAPSNGTVVYLGESHADLGIDVNGEDVYVGFKNGSCSENGNTNQGGCMGYDNDTFLVMVRLRDGETVFKFSHTDNQGYGNRGIYGGYVSCRNTKRPGWAYVTEDCCQRDGAPSTDVFAIPLNYDVNDNTMEYYGRTYAERNFDGGNGPRNDSAQAVPSRYGNMISFDSFFSNQGLFNLHEDSGNSEGPAWLLEYPQN